MNNSVFTTRPTLSSQALFLEQKMILAKQLHQQGKLEDAKKGYQALLKIQPKNAQALHGLGLISFVQKKYQEALKYLNQAIQIEQDIHYLNNRGTIYFELKKYPEAQKDYKQALNIQADFQDAQFNLANLYSETNRTSEALKIFDEIIQKQTNHIEALYNRGNTYKRNQQLKEAVIDYGRVVEIMPGHINAHLNRGNAYLGLEELDLALASYDKALDFHPDFIEALVSRSNANALKKNYDLVIQDCEKIIRLKPDHKESYFALANALKDKLFFHDAIAWYQKALALDENYYDAIINLANTLRRLKHFDEAALYYSRAVQLQPNSADAYSNLGNILHDLKRTDLAIDAYAQALQIDPRSQRVHFNLANIFKELNQLDEALEQFDHVLSIDPENIEAQFAKGMIYLAQGKYQEGFKLYEHRWERESLVTKLRQYPQALWTGKESLDGKTILVYIEQGLGDTIQFSRLIPQLAQQGARVIFEVQKPLMGLMKQIEGVAELIAHKEALPIFDYYCPLLNLPSAIGMDVEHIPLAQGYLKSNTAYVDKWQNILGEKTKPRVGLVCSGNAMHENDQNRSILLFDIIPYLPQEFEYITLQKEMREADRQLIQKYPLFKSYGDELDNFDDTAALCELMDIVISVDTSVAHLSGALAKKTFLLVPYCPDWRWMLTRQDSPWYQSMKIYRQEFMNSWQSTFTQLAKDLKKELL